jgi:hypothetical protein
LENAIGKAKANGQPELESALMDFAYTVNAPIRKKRIELVEKQMRLWSESNESLRKEAG